MIKRVLIPNNIKDHLKKNNLNLAIIIPIYNEQEHLSTVIEEWIDIAQKYQGILILMNDGSTDESFTVIEKIYQKYRDYIFAIDKKNTGHGATCLYGYFFACRLGFKWVFQTDSDGQTLASDFDQFWQRRMDYPLLFGRRGDREDGVFRKIVSQVLALVIFLIFKTNVLDANVPYRLMRVQELQQILPKIPRHFYLSNAFLAIILEIEFTIFWLPIEFKKRLGGEPSVKKGKFLKMGFKVIREFWVGRNLYKSGR